MRRGFSSVRALVSREADSGVTVEEAMGNLETALDEIILGGRDFQGADRLATQALDAMASRSDVPSAEIDRARSIALEIRSVAAGSRLQEAIPYLDRAIELSDRHGERASAARLAIRRATAAVSADEIAMAYLQLRRARRLVANARDRHLQLEYLTAQQEWLGRQGRWRESLNLAERFIVPASVRWESPQWLGIRRAYMTRARIELEDRDGAYAWLSHHAPSAEPQPESENVLLWYLQRLVEVRAMALDPGSGDAARAFALTEPFRVRHGFDPHSAREVASLLG